MFGVSLSTVWNWNNPKHKQFRPDFPKPIKVSANATGWLQSELEGYLQKLADNRQGGLTESKSSVEAVNILTRDYGLCCRQVWYILKGY